MEWMVMTMETKGCVGHHIWREEVMVVVSQEVGKHLTAVTPTDAGTREEFEADKTVAMSGDVAGFVIEWKRKVLCVDRGGKRKVGFVS